MTKYRSHVVARLCGLAALMLFAAGSARANVMAWNGAGANDSTSWAQLGANGTTIPNPFSATSASGNAITGSFTGLNGQTAVVGEGWTGAFPAGDTLVWTLDSNTNPSGPLTLALGAPVLAGGLDIQADGNGPFGAQVQAYDGSNSLGAISVNSDAAGDPVFIGVQDSVADITSLVFNLTACSGGGCSVNDFAVDTLYTINPSVVPAPPIGQGLPAVLGLGGMLICYWLSQRSRKSAFREKGMSA